MTSEVSELFDLKAEKHDDLPISNFFYLILANLSIFIGGIIGLWFKLVGTGMGHGTQVGGLFDGFASVFFPFLGTCVSFIFLLIAFKKKERPLLGYFLPAISIVLVLIALIVILYQFNQL